MVARGLCFLLVVCGAAVLGAAVYEVPDARLEALSPKGLRVSIPAENGIKLFAFHGKLNEPFDGLEGGTWSKDVRRVTNGRLVFLDENAKLKPGDTVHYWTYVDYDDGERTLGYTKVDRTWTVPGRRG